MLRIIKAGLQVLLLTIVLLSCAAFADSETESVTADGEMQVTEEATAEETVTEEDAAEETVTEEATAEETPENKLLAQIKKMLPVILGMTGNDPQSSKEWIIEQVKKIAKNPDQYSEDFWDSLFGTGADGISREGDAEEKGKISFAMELPDPVSMPDTYSVAYHRADKEKNEITTLLERDADGNIHYLDGEEETVFVRTDEGFRMYPVLKDGADFGEWDGTLLSARSVRDKTSAFWNCADQTFIKWLGTELTEETEYLGRPAGLYHAEPGTITFTYKCDMVLDDETGICLLYSADEILKGAVFNETEDDSIEISIGDYDIGGEEMNFYCTAFETENVSFEIPAA